MQDLDIPPVLVAETDAVGDGARITAARPLAGTASNREAFTRPRWITVTGLP
jgi:hypothetical protein